MEKIEVSAEQEALAITIEQKKENENTNLNSRKTVPRKRDRSKEEIGSLQEKTDTVRILIEDELNVSLYKYS